MKIWPCFIKAHWRSLSQPSAGQEDGAFSVSMFVCCPAITADVPGAREQCRDAALYFNSMSEQDLAERIRELLQNNVVRDQFDSAGTRAGSKLDRKRLRTGNDLLFDEFAAIARAWEKCDSAFT